MDAWSFWRMTAKEVRGRIEAHAANMRTANERLDLLAWMIGSYTAHAYHQPKKYPKRPSILSQVESKALSPDVQMDSDIMKTVLTAYAEIHNEIEEAKP